MKPVLVVDRLGKKFGDVSVVTDVSFTVEEGEMVALTGPSGCGKSTVLNMIGLLDTIQQGSVTYRGTPLPRPSSAGATRLRRTELGYLFQNYALIENDTVQQNLKVVASWPRLRTDGASRDSALEEVGLRGMRRRKVYTLSGGEQQRLAIARLMLKKCRLVLADEPTGSLDPQNRDLVTSLLRTLVDEGRSALIVTHDGAVADACDRRIKLG